VPGPADVLERPPPAAHARIAYGTLPLQFGDLRLPERHTGDGQFAIVTVIHGGFWRNRYDLSHIGHLCDALTRTGLATWNFEYRRIGDDGGGWPGTFSDVAAGAAYVRQLAQRFPLDPSKVVVVGHSAGGQLACWLVSARQSPREGEVSLVGAVSLAGVLDLKLAWELGLSQHVVGDLLGGSPDEVPERYAAASPIELLPGTAPRVLVHGDADANVPIELSRRYAEKARALDDEVRLVELGGVAHFEPIDPRSGAWPVVREAVHGLLDG
jgi:acetyl esterase/lipase